MTKLCEVCKKEPITLTVKLCRECGDFLYNWREEA